VIHINLLGVERPKSRKAAAFDRARQLTLACSLILAATGADIGWWYWSMAQTAAGLDADIAEAQRESARLQTVLAEVERFEARRAQLQERVALIEELRGGQSVPVQLLDHVSRSLPDMLWLTSFEQVGAAVTIQGRTTTLIGLSDFVGNLGATTLLLKPIEIVDSQVQTAKDAGAQSSADLIRFTVKAQLAPSARSKEPGGRGGAAAKRGADRGRAQGAGA
jgi:type IV pilus assembly protein PilN